MAHHHHCHGEHDHDHAEDPAMLYSLYQKIDTEKLECLNESEEGSGKTVFKAWDDRLDKTKFVESDVDEELLIYVPFTGSVKLKGVVLIGGEDEYHPRELRLFKNRPPLGFDDLRGEPDQSIQLSRDTAGTLEYPVKVTKFNGVTSLLMYIPSNLGAETTKIYYIGLRGEFAQAQRQGIVITSYEARPNPADHKTSDYNPVGGFVS
ncbi:PITH domain-containing protein 1-like [Halichondria panicea]|uniref:PITH domain-containing protein 1-like n=1 Tax=Halichondria panicea TaxID=6063 RepID=UPI00312B7F20